MSTQDPSFPFDPEFFADIMRPYTKVIAELAGYKGPLVEVNRMTNHAIAPALSALKDTQIAINRSLYTPEFNARISDLAGFKLSPEITGSVKASRQLVESNLKNSINWPKISIPDDVLDAALVNVSRQLHDSDSDELRDEVRQECAEFFPDIENHRIQLGLKDSDFLTSAAEFVLVVLRLAVGVWLILDLSDLSLQDFLADVAKGLVVDDVLNLLRKLRNRNGSD